MKILKLLNKISLSILISFFFIQNSYSEEPVDIWNLEKQNADEQTLQNENLLDQEQSISDSIFQIQTNKKSDIEVEEKKYFTSEKINIVGIYDPAKNDLSMDMWQNSNGEIILKTIEKINKVNLSNDAKEILNIALLTNSHFPEKNITREEFLKIKSDWLIKQKNLILIEEYLSKNNNLPYGDKLITYYLDYYLSHANAAKSCEIFNNTDLLINENYVSKYKIYCLINLDKREEAQLYFDLMKENNFEDKFFEKKFSYLMEYEENLDNEISEKNLLDFHLSHRTNKDFNFEPKKTTPKIIWKYLSYSNLLENVDLVDLEDREKLSTIEMATHERNYNEEELFSLYERFQFSINQLLTVENSSKLLPDSESRALVYQGVLITENVPKKIKLIKLLKDSFEKNGISNAFKNKLEDFLESIDENEVPSNFSAFYNTHRKSKNVEEKKIKYNNKIIHQSKILDYFKEDLKLNNIEKVLESILKKVKKDKKYFFSINDLIVLESLKSDGLEIPKKYENIYEKTDPNIPYDIQIFINRNEPGLVLLRLVEIIGQDKITDIDSETLYFIVSILNQLNLDKIRNNLLLKVLPLKV